MVSARGAMRQKRWGITRERVKMRQEQWGTIRERGKTIRERCRIGFPRRGILSLSRKNKNPGGSGARNPSLPPVRVLLLRANK
uniref:Uncharacterized protein n=1 Tax=Candidatus Kentrum sp. DK TaxID=2126562 RepID=A0A450TF59_9GAMM|nr:MAG: hypothetical protein BECKDK2373B_GA0170837_11523 [Candidatus Kentron sp. DK]VFJ65727.1 MAG: hypothetical protein BECKDK2373C_GA0170839_11353 [Candidatus Kentron sp. DK]